MSFELPPRPGMSSSVKCGGSLFRLVVDRRNSSGSSSSKSAMGPSLGIVAPPGADVALFLGRPLDPPFGVADLSCYSVVW